MAKIKCLECGDIIESKHRHDMMWCSCQGLFIDGGNDYVRVGGRNIYNYDVVKDNEENKEVTLCTN